MNDFQYPQEKLSEQLKTVQIIWIGKFSIVYGSILKFNSVERQYNTIHWFKMEPGVDPSKDQHHIHNPKYLYQASAAS